jgi:hypothetical protein
MVWLNSTKERYIQGDMWESKEKKLVDKARKWGEKRSYKRFIG